MLAGVDFSAGAAVVTGRSMAFSTVGRFGKPQGGPLSARTKMACKQQSIGYFPGLDDMVEF
jgi:hypothetical protein